MHALKRRYIWAMHNLTSISSLSSVDTARSPDEFGWRRWVASLFAIYDTDRMIALDIPWWNVAATREVERLLRRKSASRVFEYGSGASTVWLAKRAGEIITVEHDRSWKASFARQTKDYANVSLLHRSIDDGPDHYVQAIDEVDGEFDLIVIDGRHRVACLNHAMARLSPGGAMLFDDSGRQKYRSGIESSRLQENRFFGRSFCVPYPDHTSILTRVTK
jgi:hypothetical protein